MLKMTVLALAGMPIFGGLSLALAQTTPSPPAAPAAHPAHHRHHRPSRAARPVVAALPARPAPPVSPTSGPAPVPNEALTAPIDNTTQQTNVAPSVFQLHYPNQGDGYVTGSSPQAMDDRNAAKATGVEMKVPLAQ